jgi:hypothetical protein
LLRLWLMRCRRPVGAQNGRPPGSRRCDRSPGRR